MQVEFENFKKDSLQIQMCGGSVRNTPYDMRGGIFERQVMA